MNKDELSHVKRQMNKDSYCTSTDLEDYFLAGCFFLILAAEYFMRPGLLITAGGWPQ